LAQRKQQARETGIVAIFLVTQIDQDLKVIALFPKNGTDNDKLATDRTCQCCHQFHEHATGNLA
jgi:hypothetical protein